MIQTIKTIQTVFFETDTAMPTPDDELTVMAQEELDAACAMPFAEVRRITPWGDSFTGFAPSGREVEVERRYLWAVEPDGGVIVEVEVRDPAARAGAEARALLTEPR